MDKSELRFELLKLTYAPHLPILEVMGRVKQFEEFVLEGDNASTKILIPSEPPNTPELDRAIKGKNGGKKVANSIFE